MAHNGQLVDGLLFALRDSCSIEIYDTVKKRYLAAMIVNVLVPAVRYAIANSRFRKREHVAQIMLVEHVSAGPFVDEDVPAETILQDHLGGVEGAPAGDHVLAVTIVLDVWDNAFRHHL